MTLTIALIAVVLITTFPPIALPKASPAFNHILDLQVIVLMLQDGLALV